MQSRRKWKRRYYELRKKEKEDAEFIKKVFPDRTLKDMLAESREIQRKAEKYDLLIEKLERNICIKPNENVTRIEIMVLEEAKKQIEKYRDEILSFVKGEKK